jgi:hypothetical protein
VQGGLEVHEIPGEHRDHRSMMEEPIVPVLARKMMVKLEALESSRARGAAEWAI